LDGWHSPVSHLDLCGVAGDGGQSGLRGHYTGRSMTQQVLRKNAVPRQLLGDQGADFLEFAVQAITRLLPHARVDKWTVSQQSKPKPKTSVTWESAERRGIRFAIALELSKSDGEGARTWSGVVETVVRRQKTVRSFDKHPTTLDEREHAICKAIAMRLDGLLRAPSSDRESQSLSAIRARFDEQVIASYLASRYDFQLDLAGVFDALHKLAEMTYENRSIAFGCVIDASLEGAGVEQCFPFPFLDHKRYRAMTDGFRTAIHVAGDGCLHGFYDLDAASAVESSTKTKNYP